MGKKLTNLISLLLIILFVSTLQTKASDPEENGLQQLSVSGTIVDENGSPMPGVNIQVQGTTLGAITDINGKYAINVPGADAVLIITFVGYKE